VYGATGAAGGAPYPWKGAYATGTAYATNDCIYHNGGGYVCIQAGTGQEPETSPTYWDKLVDQGPTGPTGAAGATGVAGPTGASVSTTVKTGTDTSVASATTTITTSGLQFALLSGITYAFDFRILYQTKVAATGLKLGLIFPAATIVGANVNVPMANDAATSYWFSGYISASGGGVTATSSPAVNTTVMAQITGVIRPSANGTLHVYHACEAACASGIVIKADSVGILHNCGA